MVRSAPIPGQMNQQARRRPAKGRGLLLLILLLAALGGGAFMAVGLLAPTRLAAVHERGLALLHGGVAGVEERTDVDGCVRLPDGSGPYAVVHTVREATFADGTSLTTTFTTRPAPSRNVQCGE